MSRRNKKKNKCSECNQFDKSKQMCDKFGHVNEARSLRGKCLPGGESWEEIVPKQKGRPVDVPGDVPEHSIVPLDEDHTEIETDPKDNAINKARALGIKVSRTMKLETILAKIEDTQEIDLTGVASEPPAPVTKKRRGRPQ